MSTVVAASIVSMVACKSKVVSVIEFIARSTRAYAGFRAGMQRAMRSDAGSVQKCSDAHSRAVGVLKAP